MTAAKTLTVPAPIVSNCGRYHSIEIPLRKYTVCPQKDGRFVLELVDRDRHGGSYWICRRGATNKVAWVQNISPFESLDEAVAAMTLHAAAELKARASTATCVLGVRAPLRIPLS